MHGQITVVSERDRGSVFAFTASFGLQAQPFPLGNAEAPVLLHDMKVLIVDDNAINRHILKEWLRGWRMDATSVGDGLAAMDALWHAVNSGRPYPLVLLDARMPDTDGLTLAAKIRERAELSATRIILLTSGDRPGDLERFRELRVNAHLLKPVPEGELLDTIYAVMSREDLDAPAPRSADSAPKAALPNAPAPLTLRVLVAEDNDFNGQLIRQLLLRRGHLVTLAKNGKDALELLAQNSFDLLILDLHMPEADGFQVIAAIRAQESGAALRLPVIALTARARREDRQRCLEAGMDDFLVKPILPADLWSAIDRVLMTPSPPSPLQMGRSLLDPTVLLAACGGDAVALERLCGALRRGLPDDLAELEAASVAADLPRVMRVAHRLAGVMSAFSTVAASMASELEDYAARNELEAAREGVGRLKPIAEELIQLVDRISLDSVLLAIETAD